ncbi:MAG: hypothetical protein LBV39_07185, partial [Bacteroidales bacterium]|jgi:hypothetical protein|nr:hypothetical protein [Bacteroidales bacterium]
MKRQKSKTFLLALCCAVLLICSHITPAWANSAEPPVMVVLVEFAPDDLQLSIKLQGAMQNEYEQAIDTVVIIELDKRQTAWETVFKCYPWMKNGNFLRFRDTVPVNATLMVTSAHSTFECPLSLSTWSYHNFFTLNLKTQALTNGQTTGRMTILVSLRVILTLIIEGLIFFLFGFRQKRSWMAFLVINLLTQGALNLILTSQVFNGGYVLLLMLFLEIFVILSEAVLLTLAVKEHSVVRRLLYVLLANIASLIMGGYAIKLLPM